MKLEMRTVKNIAAAAMTLAVVFGFASLKPVTASAAQAEAPVSASIEEENSYISYQDEIYQKDFLRLIERDAEVFEPLSKAYGMPKETEEEKAEKARVMEIVLKDACSVPMEIMEKCCEAIELIVEFGAKGSKLAISDAGVGAAFCKAALQGASLNVYINTKSMADREYAEELNRKADAMLEKYTKIADDTFNSVLGRLK